MIHDTLANHWRYESLHPLFRDGFGFLLRALRESIEPGRHEIVSDRAFVIVESNEGRGETGARLEAHRKFIDIQVCLSGPEVIGWRALADCRAISEPYDDERDIMFFADQPQCWSPLARGQFMIFFPEDAHAPLAGNGPNIKAVAKIGCQ